MRQLTEYLEALEPAGLSYNQWLAVGMALKEEGYPVSVWDEWSARDQARYHSGECARKWETFKRDAGEIVTGGTVYQICKEMGCLPRISAAEDFSEDEWHPGEDLRRYIETLFRPSDIVNVVTKSYFDEKDGKYKPCGRGNNFKASDILERLKTYGDDIGAAVGDYTPAAGAWIRFNPMDGKGAGNDNVAAYRYALIESDTLSIAEQLQKYEALNLPIAALIHSGGKSAHAIVRIDAPDKETYRKRVYELFRICKENGLQIDEANKNASRLSRLPGCIRGKNYQYLISTNVGAYSWEQWKREIDKRASTEPSDYTDVGQANMLVSRYGEALKYTDATGFLAYDGTKWQESETRAQGFSQALTGLQLKEARKRTGEAKKALDAAKASEDADIIKEAKARYDAEMEFLKYVLGRRSSNKIKAALTEAKPRIEISVDDLDGDGFLLNTPGGTVDLRTGEIRPHDAKDYCTKITTIAPDMKNADIFGGFLERVTVGDLDLERYLQEVAGMCAVGKVLRENLIIAYGEGGNGKSTLFNLLAHVLGDYSGMLSAETLTVNCRKNKSPEYAELRGKRLVIAAELEEGVRMDTAALKTLCSTDKIQAEKKYKAPFSFTPSHTVILYTNHLPKIGTSDSGTWSRIIVVPFLANFRGVKGEVKNYAEYLFDHCGGAVLTWIIEGARRFISNGYDIALPECVKQAIEAYRESSDWLSQFLEECCEIGRGYSVKSSELYERYRRYCDCTGEYKRRSDDFKQALIAAGYEYRKTKSGIYAFGLKLTIEYVETPFGMAAPDAG